VGGAWWAHGGSAAGRVSSGTDPDPFHFIPPRDLSRSCPPQNIDGYRCACDCGWLGFYCNATATITPLGGLNGTLTGSTAGAPDYVPGYAGGDAFYSITVPANTSLLHLSTCLLQTEFDTVLALTSTCPAATYTFAEMG
jgi:hypothetical protein